MSHVNIDDVVCPHNVTGGLRFENGCEACDSAKMAAAQAKDEERARRKRVVALARDIFVHNTNNFDTARAFCHAESFDKGAQEYLAAPLTVAPASDNPAKENA